MSISKERPRDHHGRCRGAAALLGIVALIAAMAVSLPYLNVDNAATGAQAAGKRQPTGDVLLEPVGFAGANPFGPAVGLDVAGVVAPPNLGGTQPGNRLGLFGGTERHASCNPAGQIAYLQANPDKAAAFASVLGITPADIPGVIFGCWGGAGAGEAGQGQRDGHWPGADRPGPLRDHQGRRRERTAGHSGAAVAATDADRLAELAGRDRRKRAPTGAIWWLPTRALAGQRPLTFQEPVGSRPAVGNECTGIGVRGLGALTLCVRHATLGKRVA
jgi:hypothetical protein